MARQSLLAGVAAVAVALVSAADSTTTVSMLQPLADGARLKLRGSVVGVDGDKTTYGFGCEAGASAASCLPEGTSMTVVQGPSTFVQSIQATMSDWDGKVGGDEAEDAEDLLHQSAVISLEFSCKLNPDQNRAECGGMAGVAVGSATFMSQGTDVLTSYKEMVVPVVITAGVDKLSPAPGATQTGNVPAATGSAGASRTASAAASSLATISGSRTPASTASASTAGATTTNAAGAVVPRHLGLAGVAAGIGAALLLL
ncbi:hypothetical protein MGU_01279 [Metarhizium guizhouense ARSEF 977]|uniref:Uncharacterized protein n=1 Tax=Metarhizium guizhouense (strain ARSEF 977) TaxID=1276136 RepID=A0A0B4HAA7_METGA|nr:hypothetical protein MGU_01279 [Metarhizium guizhouense ARSEF 977]